MKSDSAIRAVAGDIRQSWKPLALTALAYQLVAFIVLTPVVGVLFRGLLALSGRSILADQDILYFFLGPAGWVCFIVVGGLAVAIFALEQAALLGILGAVAGGNRARVVGALQFAAARAREVVKVAARMLAIILLAAAPFLVFVGLIYFAFLGQYDINYYLKEKPPAFVAAVGLAGITGAGFVVLIIRLATSWFFALPLVLFENVTASNALRVSRDRVIGHRRTVLAWIVGWALALLVLSTVTSAIVLLVGRTLVPRATGSLGLLTVAVGVTVCLSVVANLITNLLSITTLAAVILRLYRNIGGAEHVEWPTFNNAGLLAGRIEFTLTRKRLAAGAVVGTLLAAVVGIAAIETVQLEDHAEIIAHRGASADAPENTLAAVRQAIEDKADWVEIDVQETGDGEVVVMHDSDFMKIAGVNLKIWDAKLADLADIDIGNRFDPAFKDERVPTLDDVLATCKGKIRVIIELKYYGHDQNLEQRVIDLVEARAMADDIVVMSLKYDAVQKMKSLRPEWTVGLLTSVAVGDITGVDADFLAVNTSLAKRSFIRSAHQSGKDVYVWTVNDAVTMSTMIGRGVDGLITDKPALARTVLQKRAEMSAPQRVMFEFAGLLGVTPELGEP